MKFFLTAFILGVSIASIDAEFEAIFNIKENNQVAEATGLTVPAGDNVKAYAEAYATFRNIENNATQKFPSEETPEGVICLFTIKIDSNGARKVIKLDDNGTKIEDSEIDIESPLPKFKYVEESIVDDSEDEAIELGKNFIQKELSIAIMKHRTDLGSVAYARINFRGELEGQYQGNYMLFAVIYT